MVDKAFIFDWVLINKLAIGTPLLQISDVEFIKQKGIRSILNLCSEKEAPFNHKENKFKFIRFPLPDHKHKELITNAQIIQSVNYVDELLIYGPVFVHCVASVERSPLICMAWLMKNLSLNFRESWEYMRQVHPQTNPLSSQLKQL